jgi:hypothetical protein
MLHIISLPKLGLSNYQRGFNTANAKKHQLNTGLEYVTTGSCVGTVLSSQPVCWTWYCLCVFMGSMMGVNGSEENGAQVEDVQQKIQMPQAKVLAHG